MAVDPRILRSALIPLIIIVCVTIALWQLRAHEHPPTRGAHQGQVGGR